MLDCSHSRCSVLTSINQAKLSSAMCTVTPWYALGPSFNPPLRCIHHWRCVTEGIASPERGTGPFRADAAFPYTAALPSPTFKARPPDQRALAHHGVPPVAHRLATAPIPSLPSPQLGEASSHKRPLQTQLYKYIIFSL